MIRFLLLFPLASCSGLKGTLPHYYEVTGGYGVSEFDRPVNDFDSTSLFVTLGWYGDRYFRDVGKSNAYWSRYSGSLDDLGEVPGRLSPNADATSFDEAALFGGLVPPKPKTEDEGRALAWWGVAVLLLACAVLVVAYARKMTKNGKERPKAGDI